MNYTYTEYYVLTDASLAAMNLFHEEREQSRQEFISWLDRIGADTARVDAKGDLVMANFSDVAPEGWRKLYGRSFAPHKGTKKGKALSLELKDIPKVRSYTQGFSDHWPEIANLRLLMNDERVSRTSVTRFVHPEVAYAVSVPRDLDDDLKIPEDWVEISEREYTILFRDHNAKVEELGDED